MGKGKIAILVILLPIPLLLSQPSAYSDESIYYPDVSEWDVWEHLNNETKPLQIDLWPGITELEVWIYVPRDRKTVFTCYFIGNLKGLGKYTVIFHIVYVNQYDKWNHWVEDHWMAFNPVDIPKNGGPRQPDRQPAEIFVLRQLHVCYQNVTCKFEAQKLGEVYCFCESHCIMTDVNGDGKVNIIDISLIAREYGKTLEYGYKDPLLTYDMDVDFRIFDNDLALAAIDFGQTIPP